MLFFLRFPRSGTVNAEVLVPCAENLELSNVLSVVGQHSFARFAYCHEIYFSDVVQWVLKFTH